MAYVSVPKDLSTVKTKVVLNLTKRQLICFSAALAVGLPLFFLTKDSVGTSASSLLMIFSMLPLFMFALYEKHGQPLEVILKHYIEVRFLNPKQRPYKTENFYAVLMRQEKLDKEVKHIVERRKTISPKANKGRKAEN
ncbi:PrgI family protein [Dehalobacter restrictus]|jgi:cytosine/uracil/thiamine/allantoin permease|uniref:PrgI family protein n=1 Tax=Dehalobacter restrictus TaxID=55583 RepID=A0A857DI49_9FIRM|nr:PrgI family protein [Dehalobacter restrictus]QHA01020.1 PrgI family protein [Dehalobacter restrictus]